MPFEERTTILDRMHMVDNVYGVDDEDGSVTKGLIQVRDAEQRGDFHMYQPTGTKWMKCKRKKRKHAQYKEAIQKRLRSRGVG